MKIQATTHGGRAFTLTDMFVVVGVVAVVAALLLPVLAKTHRKSSRIGCTNNLKQIDLSFRSWGTDNDDKYPMQVSVTNDGAMEPAVVGDVSAIFRVMSNEVSTPKILVCPQDTDRHYSTNFAADLNHQTISYFVGLEAEEQDPQMMLAGDDNLEINGARVRPGILNLSTKTSVGWTKERTGPFHSPGNILLADGSVQATTSADLQQAFHQTGVTTNRLVIP